VSVSGSSVVARERDRTQKPTTFHRKCYIFIKTGQTQTKQYEPTVGNETQVGTMRAGLAITQEETIRNRADNHRDRKCRETEDTRDRDFKIRHKNSGS